MFTKYGDIEKILQNIRVDYTPLHPQRSQTMIRGKSEMEMKQKHVVLSTVST